MTTKTIFTVELDRKHYEYLRDVRNARGVSMNDIINEIIGSFMQPTLVTDFTPTDEASGYTRGAVTAQHKYRLTHADILRQQRAAELGTAPARIDLAAISYPSSVTNTEQLRRLKQFRAKDGVDVALLCYILFGHPLEEPNAEGREDQNRDAP